MCGNASHEQEDENQWWRNCPSRHPYQSSCWGWTIKSLRFWANRSPPEKSPADQSEKMSTSQLIVWQHEDPETLLLFVRNISENEEASQNPTCYFTKNGVLMKKWRPPDVPAKDEWAVKYQIVVPKTCRQEILGMAQETPLAGYLGVTRLTRRSWSISIGPTWEKM